MPFSHHSHSGQFCGHAQNTLEEMVQIAIEKGMEMLAFTEHMPREEEDFYPEERKAYTTATLSKLFEHFYMEARRLQREYQPKIKLLVGMEADWIRPQSKEFFEDLLEKYQFDLFVGSVHHVHTIPIDYNQDMYVKAREKSGGTDEGLFEDYFDLQLDMLRIMRPPIVGHFDLIRLLSDNKDVTLSRFGGVWRKILRNLDFISHYGGVVELNSAALRKGMVEPYPQMEICKAFAARGGHFTLSDDSHCTGHVGTHYAELMHFVERAGNLHIVVFEKGAQTKDSRFPGVSSGTISLANIQGHSVFN